MYTVFDSPIRALVLLLAAFALTGCNGAPDRSAFDVPIEDEMFGTLPAEKALEAGKSHYREGQFGLAERAFRRAVEQDKNNVEAWLGVAASCDRLRRFDQAGRAYEVVMRLSGRTPAVLNNLGYHYILRGDLERARSTLLEAKRHDPENQHIRNNLELIGGADPGPWTPRVDPNR
jgi:Flp pilus assembly protein TadD